MIFKEKVKIQLKDIGKNNLIKNIGILEILENVATHHSDLVGFGPNDVEKTGISWILLDWKLEVLKRPKYGDELTINTWGRTIDGIMKKAYTYRDFEIYDSQNNLCVLGTSKWAILNLNTGRIMRIENNIMDKYEVENKNVFDMGELEKIVEPQNFLNMQKYKVTRRDIDLNGHMHNLNYLDLAYEALPEDIYNKRPFNNVRIQYKKEIKYGDIVECKYSYENDEHIVTIGNVNCVNAIVVLK